LVFIVLSDHLLPSSGSPVYGDPNVTISFTDDELITSFDEGVNSVMIPCNVECQFPEGAPRGSTVMVTLNLVDDWSYIEIQSWSFVKGDPPTTLNFHYQVLRNFIAGTEITISVSGSWTYLNADGQGQIPLISRNVIVGEYGRIRILRYGQASPIQLKPGEWYEIKVEISNMGNVECLFELDFPSIPANLQVDTERSSFMIDAFSMEIFTIRIKLKDGSEIDDEISIRTSAVVKGSTYSDTLVLPVGREVDENEAISSMRLMSILIGAFFVAVFFITMLIFWIKLRSDRKRKGRMEGELP
jgi:hypothetical protein